MKSPRSSFLFLALSFFCLHTLQAQWNRQYPLPKLEDVLDIDVKSDGYGFAAGTKDLLLRKQAGSNQWDMLPGFGEGWRFEAVDYLDGSGGEIAAAGGGGLILTTDNGDHWTSIAGAPAFIHSLKVFSSTHIILIADDDAYDWNNGTWTNLNVPTTFQLKGGFIRSDQSIWANTFTNSPTIYYTTNGGASWNSSPDVPKVDVLTFFDALNGIALDGRNVYKTTNGGQNWTEIAPNGLTNSANDLSYGATANVLVAATLNAKPNISTDGGLTWTAITTPLVNLRSHSVIATSNTEFWIGNDLSSVMHSTDGGMTWTETSGPVRNIIQDVYFINRNTGFAIGIKGLLLRTTDGGANWEDKSFGTRSHFSIHGLNVNDLWIGTNQHVLHSVNAGDTWTESIAFQGGNISDVLAISHDRILATSTTGTIFLSKNAGMTWDSVYSSGLQMRSLAKIDDQKYMATGFNGVIVRSDDQGQTWHAVSIPEAGLQYEQSFFINGEGWLITSSFKRTMWHTTNAGNSWDTLALPIDRFWDGLYFITKDTGVIVGRTATEGRAYLTYDGGHHWQPGYITPFPLFGATGVPDPNGTAWIFGYGSDIENLTYCNSLPMISALSGELTPCQKDTVLYTVASQNVEDFIWQIPIGWQIIGNANNDSLHVIVGLTPGNISVTGSNTCGMTSQLNIVSSPGFIPVLSNISGEVHPCQGGVVSFTVSQTGADALSWTFPADWQIVGPPGLPTIMLQVGALGGTISVTGSNACGVSPAKIFNVLPRLLPTIAFISGNLSPCAGDTIVYTYTGDISTIFTLATQGLDDWTILSQAGNTITAIAGNEAGSMQVFAMNDCGFSTPLVINLTPKFVPQVAILASGAKLFPSATGVSYQWYLNGQLLPGIIADTITPTLSGSYTVLVTFATGCHALSFPVEVVISAVATLSYIPLHVYPVPATDQLFLSGIEGEITYSIIDLLGKPITTDKTTDNKILIGYLTPGMYLLKAEKGNKIYLAKFIRN